MGYYLLDRAKALMGLEVKTGIDCAKSVISVLRTGERPDYPSSPYAICRGTHYWLREASQWGRAEWPCSRCHPKPQGANGQ